MSEWKEQELSELAELRKDSWKVGDEQLPYIALEHMVENGLRLQGIGDSLIVASNKYYFDSDNFLFGKLRPYFRKLFRPNFKGICSTDIWVVKPKGENEKDFLFYFFANQEFIDYSYSGSSGTRMPRADWNFVSKMKWKFPEPKEQHAIASVLSSLDDKIDLLHRQNQTLEQMAETLFRQWFVEEAEVISNRQLVIGDLIESVSITHKFPNQEIIFLNTSDIYLGDVLTHSTTEVKGLPGQAKKTIKKGDILFSEIRPANGRYAFIDFEAENYVVSTKLMVLRNKNVVSQEFIYFYLINPKTIQELQLIAESRSGTFPQITFDNLKDFRINIPSDEKLFEAESLCKELIKKTKSNQTQIRTLTALRDTLLPKLMSGEVRVELE